MKKRIILLIIILACISSSAAAQRTPADLIREIEGISPSQYQKISRQAELSLSQGNFVKAAEEFEKLTRAYPLDGVKWRRLGFALYQAGKFREAVQPFMKANDLGHPLGRILTGYYIAASYAQAGDTENALNWLEKIVYDYHYAGKKYLLDDSAFKSVKTEPRFLRLFNLPKKEYSRDAGWRVDLQFLLAEIKRLNPVYRGHPLPGELAGAASSLNTRIPKLTDAQIFFEMQHLLTLMGQSHNGLLPFLAGDKVKLKQFPLTFYLFPDGLYIVDASQPYEDLIGARVVLFDKTPAERAIEATKYVVARENDMEVVWRAPHLVRIVQLLHFLKLTARPDGADLTVTDRLGKTRVVRPVPVEVERGPKLMPPRLPGLPSPPLYLSRPDDDYWFEPMPADKTVYFQFNQVSNKETGESLARFSLRLREFLDKNDIENLIVDVRRNNGGSTDLYVELLRTLIGFEVRRPGKLFVIIGRNTFSATGNFITDLSRLTNAVFVGEASGGKPLLVGGDEAPITLPYSGAMGNLSSSTWALTNPHDSRLWIAPHIPVQLTAKDYFANRDTVMEAILAILREPKN